MISFGLLGFPGPMIDFSPDGILALTLLDASTYPCLLVPRVTSLYHPAPKLVVEATLRPLPYLNTPQPRAPWSLLPDLPLTASVNRERRGC